MSYRRSSGRFRGHDGLELFCQFWLAPDPAPERSLVIHHGFGEHSGRYENVLEALAGEGVSVYSYDARGHGRSRGARGDADGVLDYVRDLEVFLNLLETERQVQKPILLGHSMGGLTALAFAVTHSNQWHLRALALSAPALRPRLDFAQRLKTSVGRALYPFAPRLTLDSGLPPEWISRDPRAVAAYKNDPLVHGKISVRMGLGLIEAGARCSELANRLRLPILIQHGSEDRLADMNASVELYQRIASADRELEIYPGCYHEIFNELPGDRDRVLADLRRWLLSHWSDSAAPIKSDTSASKLEPPTAAAGLAPLSPFSPSESEND